MLVVSPKDIPIKRFLPKNEGSAKAIDDCFSILLDEKSNLTDCPLPRKFRSFKFNVNTDPSDELNPAPIPRLPVGFSVSFTSIIIFSGAEPIRVLVSTLLKNPMYKTIVRLLSNIGMRVENSYKCIEKWMIYFNSKIGETLSQYNSGVFRYCRVLNTNHKSIPSPLIDYISWGETNSGYSLYKKELSHGVLGVSYYAQMSSPIRRIVDILNMIEMHEQKAMCKLSANTIHYKNRWLTKIEDINTTIRSIKRLESDTKLLKYYLNTENVSKRVYEGYIVAILDEKIFKVFIPELEVTSILKRIQPMALYTKIQCTLCLLQDEVNIIQKIRLNII